MGFVEVFPEFIAWSLGTYPVHTQYHLNFFCATTMATCRNSTSEIFPQVHDGFWIRSAEFNFSHQDMAKSGDRPPQNESKRHFFRASINVQPLGRHSKGRRKKKKQEESDVVPNLMEWVQPQARHRLQCWIQDHVNAFASGKLCAAWPRYESSSTIFKVVFEIRKDEWLTFITIHIIM